MSDEVFDFDEELLSETKKNTGGNSHFVKDFTLACEERTRPTPIGATLPLDGFVGRLPPTVPQTPAVRGTTQLSFFPPEKLKPSVKGYQTAPLPRHKPQTSSEDGPEFSFEDVFLHASSVDSTRKIAPL